MSPGTDRVGRRDGGDHCQHCLTNWSPRGPGQAVTTSSRLSGSCCQTFLDYCQTFRGRKRMVIEGKYCEMLSLWSSELQSLRRDVYSFHFLDWAKRLRETEWRSWSWRVGTGGNCRCYHSVLRTRVSVIKTFYDLLLGQARQIYLISTIRRIFPVY